MRKRILKRKKRIKISERRKRAVLFAAAACLLMGAALPVYGEGTNRISDFAESVEEEGSQAPKIVITDIYHRHIGDADASGGCYSMPVSHVHQGSEEAGGACYQTPVQHIHQGNADTEGGCYLTPVYHEHQGDDRRGGECYEPVLHTHTDACFEAGLCVVYYTQEETIGTWEETCLEHQKTTFVRSRGTAAHENCGMGTVNTEQIYCQKCGFNSPTVHDYNNQVCGLEEGDAAGYQLNCGKTIDRYEAGCGKEENEIEAYALSCNRILDGYGLGCGMTEDVPCGKLIVTNETPDREEQVILSVKIEDLTGGKLKVSSNPYAWQDEAGNYLGNGEQIRVDKNGTYTVTVKLDNKDVDERGLSSKILVDNIYKPQPSASPMQTELPSQKPEPADSPTPEPVITETPEPGASETSSPENMEGDESEPDIQEITPTQEEKDEKVLEISENREKKSSGKKRENEPGPSPSGRPPLMKETKQVTLPEQEAMGEIQYKVEQKEKRSGIFDNPVVRVITITTGLAILLLGISLLFLYLRRSVKIYNDNGEGRMLYLGRCLVGEEEDTYAITITETMVEKAYTNRYCIKPGLFRIGKKEGEELVVHKEAKSIAVYLSREMIVML